MVKLLRQLINQLNQGKIENKRFSENSRLENESAMQFKLDAKWTLPISK